jgi:hypothetical protein
MQPVWRLRLVGEDYMLQWKTRLALLLAALVTIAAFVGKTGYDWHNYGW